MALDPQGTHKSLEKRQKGFPTMWKSDVFVVANFEWKLNVFNAGGLIKFNRLSWFFCCCDIGQTKELFCWPLWVSNWRLIAAIQMPNVFAAKGH